jgi:hypothetical protein
MEDTVNYRTDVSTKELPREARTRVRPPEVMHARIFPGWGPSV